MRFTEILAASLATGLAFAAPTVIELDERGLPCSSKSTSTTSTSSALSSSSTSSSTSSSIATTSSVKSSSSSSSSSASSVVASTSTISSSSTTTLAAATVTPSNPAVVGSFVYGGCVAEPFFNGVAGVRALTGNSTSSDSMTVEYCASFCSGYTYFGVEYSSQCFCGNALSSGTTLDNTVSDCTAICSGNAGEYCGGSSHLNLYQLSSAGTLNLPTTYSVSSTSATATATGSGSGSGSASASTTSAAATVVASALASTGGYNFIACAVEAFANGASGRSLGDAGTSNGTAMTVEYCASFCSGYTYFGVEYADECYCGNSIATGTTQDTTGGCNMACVGNSAEQCGGSGRFNLYGLASSAAVVLPTTYVAPTTSSSTSSAAATSVAASTSSSSSSSAVPVTTAAASTSSVAATTSKASSSSAAAATTTSKASSTVSASSKTSSAAASTATTCAPASYDISTCTAITQNFPLFGNYKFSNYYNGNGYTENTSNPGNLWSLILPPITIAIPATNNACQAAAACMLKGGLLSVVYHSFDLHWRTDSCAWECTMFAGQNTASSYFNVPNSVVGRGFGFSGSSC